MKINTKKALQLLQELIEAQKKDNLPKAAKAYRQLLEMGIDLRFCERRNNASS